MSKYTSHPIETAENLINILSNKRNYIKLISCARTPMRLSWCHRPRILYKSRNILIDTLKHKSRQDILLPLHLRYHYNIKIKVNLEDEYIKQHKIKNYITHFKNL